MFDIFDIHLLSGAKVIFFKFKNSNVGYLEYTPFNFYWVLQEEHSIYIIDKEYFFNSLSTEDKVEFMFHADEFDFVTKAYDVQHWKYKLLHTEHLNIVHNV